MKLRDLEISLQVMQRFDAYDSSTFKLDSYPTPATIASAILFSAEMDHGDIADKVVCDLGCGDGVFAHGAALIGAEQVIGIDIHSEVVSLAKQNSVEIGTEDKTCFILGDVNELTLKNSVDTVFENPPFGTRQRGADMAFLRKAMAMAKIVYSIHLAGTDGKNRAFLKEKIEELGGSVTQVETFQFPIKAIYERHQKEKHLITVDLYRIQTNL